MNTPIAMRIKTRSIAHNTELLLARADVWQDSTLAKTARQLLIRQLHLAEQLTAALENDKFDEFAELFDEFGPVVIASSACLRDLQDLTS